MTDGAEMCLHFLQGEGLDPTQTSTSSGSQQIRKSKTQTQLNIIMQHILYTDTHMENEPVTRRELLTY